jgi:hypothetical protein
MNNSVIPKEGTIFTKDKSKKLDFVKTYSRFKIKIYNLIQLRKKDKITNYSYSLNDSKILKRDNFLEYIEKKQYEI